MSMGDILADTVARETPRNGSKLDQKYKKEY